MLKILGLIFIIIIVCIFILPIFLIILGIITNKKGKKLEKNEIINFLIKFKKPCKIILLSICCILCIYGVIFFINSINKIHYKHKCEKFEFLLNEPENINYYILHIHYNAIGNLNYYKNNGIVIKDFDYLIIIDKNNIKIDNGFFIVNEKIKFNLKNIIEINILSKNELKEYLNI